MAKMANKARTAMMAKLQQVHGDVPPGLSARAEGYYNKFVHPGVVIETPKSIRIDVWWLGILHRCLQLFVAGVFFYQMLFNGGWAHIETPTGSVNAYVGGTGRAFVDTISAFRKGTTKPSYCDNQKYAFSASKPPYFWIYDAPVCEALDWQEFTVKDPTGALFVKTMFIEQHHYGWFCPGSGTTVTNTPARAQGCNNAKKEGEQCFCFTKRTFAPVGAEKVDVSFGHSFQTSAVIDGGLQGSSVQPKYTVANYRQTLPGGPREMSDGDGKTMMVQRLLFDNFTEGVPSTWKVITGSTGGTLEEILRDAGGLPAGLDTFGGAGGTTDYADKDKTVSLRTGGVSVKVEISYSNIPLDQVTGIPAADVPTSDQYGIGVNIKVRADLARYAGPGQETFYIDFPVTSGSAQAYHKVTRYSQGVIMTFEATGTIYWFEYMAFINSIVALVVFSGIVGSLTRMIALNLIPSGVSTMLKNQAQEKAEQKRQMAMIGIRMIIAAIQYKKIDGDNCGVIAPGDLFRVLAELGDTMGFEKAYSMSHMILDEADKKGTSTLDFEEYFGAMEPLLSFEQYVKAIPVIKEIETRPDYAEMKTVWDKIQADDTVQEFTKNRGLKRQATQGVIIA